jgi:peptide/nickel transport system substrate-binding protein
VKLGRGLLVAALAGSAAAVGCGDGGSGEKSIVIAAGGDADHILPLLYTAIPGQVYSDLMFEKLADLNMSQNTVGDAGYEPRLATGWRWSGDSLAVTFALDSRAKWHDGHPVRASDVRFGFQLLTDPRVAANGGAELARNVDSVTATDSLTVTVWYKKRELEQFHAVAYNLFALPEHLLASVPRDSVRQSAFAKAPVGNGPFRFVAWEKGRRFEVAAFDDFARGRPKLDRVIFIVPGDAGAAARAVIAGDADFIERTTLDDVAQMRSHPELRLVPYRGYEYGFLSFNMRTPDGRSPHAILASREMRRALTMATDRLAIVRNVHDSLARAAIGPFSRSQWTADTALAPLAYDVAAAERMLDSLGWAKGADGVRAKGGKPLALTMLVAATNRARVRYAELVQQAFSSIGVKASIDAVDLAAFGQRLARHQFDLALFTWRPSPSPGGSRLTWIWEGFNPKGGITNAGGYRNPAFDAHLDSALSATSLGVARSHFSAAYAQAIDDPPAIWIYEPFNVAAAHSRLVTGAMRPDAWWQSLSTWDVTGPAQRANATKSATP